jgi:lipopolysaccharide assembly outer membrane protein LptD (OstA)
MLFFLLTILLSSADNNELQFKAKNYQRDLTTDIIKGSGGAWVKKGAKEIWADTLEIDFKSKRVIANGNIHVKEGEYDIWARHANYNMDGEDAVLEDAVVSLGQIVMTGQIIRKTSSKHFEIEEGAYSNCNILLSKGKDIGQCNFDWKVYGKFISITIDGYAQIQDALLYAKQLPVAYFPYFIAPIKTKRETGFLMPSFTYQQILGNGINVPFFLNLSHWQDITLTPTWYTTIGYYIGFNYRYLYTPTKNGDARFFLLQKGFSEYPDPNISGYASHSKYLGLFGEWGINVRNQFSLFGRAQTRQIFKLVSDPLYSQYYAGDMQESGDSAYYRSQVSFTWPADNRVFQTYAQYNQSLIIPKDTGVDRGSVIKLPAVNFSQTTTSILSRYLAFELDTQLTNFYRPTLGFDMGPINPGADYQTGNYIRTGRRFIFTPKLIVTLPMPQGFQLQPIIRGQALVYQFDYPSSSFANQQTAGIEVPLTMYLSNTFNTPFTGYEKLKHIFQPRVIYSSTPFQLVDSNHPFFFVDNANQFSNPRFDAVDLLTPYEYFRFELINRVLRKNDNNNERFVLIQLSEQFNNKISNLDPRFSKRIGPIELLGEIKIWRFYAQTQALYQIETTDTFDGSGNLVKQVRENSFSATLMYADPNGDSFSVNSRYSIKSDENQTEKIMTFGLRKVLPIIFDVEGSLEYNLKINEILGYRLGIIFSSKPRNCWQLTFSTGRNTQKQPFALFSFQLNFGAGAMNALKPG